MSNTFSIRVIKLGGSLLDLDHVCEKFEAWIANQPVMHNVLIVGGGKLVDAIRDLHNRFDLDERETHWLAVDMLKVTTGAISKRIQAWPVTNSLEQLRAARDSNAAVNQIFVSGEWLRQQQNVPESWDVTTDSIAALVASELNAAELVLLKSAASPSLDGNFEEHVSGLSHSGYVDATFPQSFGNTETLRLVNFRDKHQFETRLSRR